MMLSDPGELQDYVTGQMFLLGFGSSWDLSTPLHSPGNSVCTHATGSLMNSSCAEGGCEEEPWLGSIIHSLLLHPTWPMKAPIGVHVSMAVLEEGFA